MALINPSVVYDEAVYMLTPIGNNELQRSETSLTPEQIELLVRIDGETSVGEIKKSARLLASDKIPACIKELARQGYIDLVSNQITQSLDFIEFFNEKPKPVLSKAKTRVRSEAESGTSVLHKKGFYVRIARRRAARKQPTTAHTLTVVVIEDDENLAKFLRHFLEMEGFATRGAANRDEIVAAIGSPPPPDLVLLDVMLPDADGFDVLLKMREHPVLKSVPVLMLTAKTTRDSVLKGLACGADGYVTKPFEIEALIKAVRTVLGVPKNPFDKRSGDPWSQPGRA